MSFISFEQFLQILRKPIVYSTAGLSEPPIGDYAMILYSQAWHETGGFTSNIYKTKNNLFGMRMAIIRKRFWIALNGDTSDAAAQDDLNKATKLAYDGKTVPEARYSNIDMSIADRLNWDVYNGIYYTNGARQYMELVQGKNKNGLRFATDPKYIPSWVRVLWTQCDKYGLFRIPVEGFGTKAGPGVEYVIGVKETNSPPLDTNVPPLTDDGGKPVSWFAQRTIIGSIPNWTVLAAVAAAAYYFIK